MDDETLSAVYFRLIETGIALSTAKNLDSLLKETLFEAKSIANAEGGAVYLQTDGIIQLTSIMLSDSEEIASDTSAREANLLPDVQLVREDGSPDLSNIVSSAAYQGLTLVIDDSRTSDKYDFSDFRPIDIEFGRACISMLTTPFLNLSGECVGILQLFNSQNESGEVIRFLAPTIKLIEALASQASVAITNRKLLDEHEELKVQLERKVDARTDELKEALAKLSELNTIDAVAGVRNRRYFDDVMGQEWRRARREGYTISLLLLDIDNFKQVNDKYGHLVGDECLAAVASRIDAMFHRPSDVVARYGGDEFAVILPHTTAGNASTLAEELQRKVERETFIVDGHELNVTISIGVAEILPGATNAPRDLIGLADNRLYEIKADDR